MPVRKVTPIIIECEYCSDNQKTYITEETKQICLDWKIWKTFELKGGTIYNMKIVTCLRCVDKVDKDKYKEVSNTWNI